MHKTTPVLCRICPRTRDGTKQSDFTPHFHRKKLKFFVRYLLDNPEV